MRNLCMTLIVLAAGMTATAAQQMGSSNRDAPKVSQTITFADGATVQLEYTAITWSEGQWHAALQDEERRAGMRQRINDTATRRPLGALTTSADVELAGQKIPAGSYAMAFTLSEDFTWQLRLSEGENTMICALELAPAEQPSKRLILSLYAGESAGSAGIYLSFGQQMGDLAVQRM